MSDILSAIESLAARIRHLETLEYFDGAWLSHLAPLLMPEIRAYWPFSSIDELGNVYDISGQGRTLTNNNGTGFGYGNGYPYPYLLPEAIFEPPSLNYFSRADEAALEPLAGQGISVGCVVRPDGGWSEQGIISKWTTAGDNRSYRLVRTGSETLRFDISEDGTAGTVFSVESAILEGGRYYVVVAGFDFVRGLSLWVNGTKTTGTLPAAAFAGGTAALEIGRTDGTDYFEGGISRAWIAGYLPLDEQVEAVTNHLRTLLGV